MNDVMADLTFAPGPTPDTVRASGGTVRAEAAVIAWLRHQTTAYDSMMIPRVKGKRREVRRLLARQSQELLDRYRRGEPAPDGCPLWRAVAAAAPGTA